MKMLTFKIFSLLTFVAAVSIGCKASALNDAGQAEKQKEQTGIDNRANAIDKMANSSGN